MDFSHKILKKQKRNKQAPQCMCPLPLPPLCPSLLRWSRHVSFLRHTFCGMNMWAIQGVASTRTLRSYMVRGSWPSDLIILKTSPVNIEIKWRINAWSNVFTILYFCEIQGQKRNKMINLNTLKSVLYEAKL